MNIEFPPAVITLPKPTSDVITLPNGDKAYQLWYGKIETVDELLLGLELARLKIEHAKLLGLDEWLVLNLKVVVSGNTHKLKQLGYTV